MLPADPVTRRLTRIPVVFMQDREYTAVGTRLAETVTRALFVIDKGRSGSVDSASAFYVLRLLDESAAGRR